MPPIYIRPSKRSTAVQQEAANDSDRSAKAEPSAMGQAAAKTNAEKTVDGAQGGSDAGPPPSASGPKKRGRPPKSQPVEGNGGPGASTSAANGGNGNGSGGRMSHGRSHRPQSHYEGIGNLDDLVAAANGANGNGSGGPILRRGRSRMVQSVEGNGGPVASLAAANGGNGNGSDGPKKRGRPRKADQNAVTAAKAASGADNGKAGELRCDRSPPYQRDKLMADRHREWAMKAVIHFTTKERGADGQAAGPNAPKKAKK